MNVYEVVTKLIGPIEPIGETNADRERLENLKAMTLLIDKLLYDVSMVCHFESRVEYSMKIAGEHANKFMKDLKEQ